MLQMVVLMSCSNHHVGAVLRSKHSPCSHIPHHPGELQGIIARVQYSDSTSPHLQTVDQLRVKLGIEWQGVEHNMADTPEMEPWGEKGVLHNTCRPCPVNMVI